MPMPSAVGRGPAHQHVGRVDHHVRVVERKHAVGGRRGLESRMRAGQAGRVREGGARTGLAAPDLGHEQRLLRTPAHRREREEAAAVEEALDIETDGAGRRILDQVFEHVAQIDIALIAERDAGAEALRRPRGPG